MRLIHSILVPSLLLVAGCAASLEGRYQFGPSPYEILVQPDGADAPVARVLVAMRGVQDADPDRNLPLGLEVRLRVENLSDAPVTIDREALVLVDGELNAFQSPFASVPGNLTAMPKNTFMVALRFPFPQGMDADDVAFEGLNLRMGFSWPGAHELVSARFERVLRMDPYYVAPSGYGLMKRY